MNKNRIWLIVGIIIAVLGFIQYSNYQDNSTTVTATISDIQTGLQTDDGDYLQTYYGDYTFNGETYTHVKLESRYEDSQFPRLHTGDTMEIVVSNDNPGHKMSEGGLFGTIGFVMIVWNVVALRKAKKAAAQGQTPPQEATES